MAPERLWIMDPKDVTGWDGIDLYDMCLLGFQQYIRYLKGESHFVSGIVPDRVNTFIEALNIDKTWTYKKR